MELFRLRAGGEVSPPGGRGSFACGRGTFQRRKVPKVRRGSGPGPRSACLPACPLRPARGKPNGLDFLPRSLRAAMAIEEPFSLIDERLWLCSCLPWWESAPQRKPPAAEGRRIRLIQLQSMPLSGGARSKGRSAYLGGGQGCTAPRSQAWTDMPKGSTQNGGS